MQKNFVMVSIACGLLCELQSQICMAHISKQQNDVHKHDTLPCKLQAEACCLGKHSISGESQIAKNQQ
jgi:hypothetical protein